MQPVRMKAQVPTDLEGIRRLLLSLAPRMESRQPGITAQLSQADLRQPMQMMVGKNGESVTIHFDPQGAHETAIKVEARPPYKPMGKWRAGFWRWRTRLLIKMTLKRAKLQLERSANAPIEPEVLPPEGR